MKVKICGITSEADALAAVEAGADALGFIFVQSSPRYISPARAASIIRSLPPFVTTVGVFVDALRSEILAVIAETGIRCIQLHGEEGPRELLGWPIMAYKAFRVSAGFDVNRLSAFGNGAYLLDTYRRGVQGGTGETFDWEIALRAKQFGRIILGGGITPENVADAVRIVFPYALDVNSGIESAPGTKDKQKLRKLFEAIRIQESQC